MCGPGTLIHALYFYPHPYGFSVAGLADPAPKWRRAGAGFGAAPSVHVASRSGRLSALAQAVREVQAVLSEKVVHSFSLSCASCARRGRGAASFSTLTWQI